MRNKLPKNIIFRPKKGFGMPIAQWIRRDLKDLVLDILSESSVKQQGIFNYQYISNLLTEHFSGKKDNRKLLWTLMIFQIWYHNN